MQTTHCPVLVLISGRGTNLQALIDASVSSNFKIDSVISNNPDAAGLQRAEREGIPTLVLNHREFSSRQEFDMALLEAIDKMNPRLIVLAGFMRIPSGEFVRHFSGRIINVHPSLLPKYPGVDTHQRAIDAGDQQHGVSVHFVTEEMDGGPIIAQEIVPILADDSAEDLAQRVLTKEHLILPKVVSWFAADRLEMREGRAYLDGDELAPGGVEIKPS